MYFCQRTLLARQLGVSLVAAAGLIAAALTSDVLAGSPIQGQILVPFLKVAGQDRKTEVQKVEKTDTTKKPVEAKKAAMEKSAEPKAAKKAVEVQVIDGANPQAQAIDNITKNYIRQFEALLAIELRLLSTVADPSAEERRAIAIEAGRALKPLAKKFAEAQMGINQGVFNNTADPRKVLEDSLKTAAKARLKPESWARYEKEMAARAADRREAEVVHLTATLDKLLMFTKEQREKVVNSLRDHWEVANFPTIETATMYDGYYPVIGGNTLNPILDDNQKKIWASAMKISYSSIRHFAFANNVQAKRPGTTEDPDVAAAFAEETPR